MGRLLWFLSLALAALVAGSASAIYATQTLRPTGTIAIGPWEAVSAVGDASADPYAHAYIASSGQFPPGSAEGMRFVALTGSDGRALVPGCSIVVQGRVEVARLWTLGLAEPSGLPLIDANNPDITNQTTALSESLAIHSQDIVYQADGSFALSIGPRPQAPNTMLYDTNQSVSLVLHVYDGAINDIPESGDAALPTIGVGSDGPGCN